MAVPCTSEWNGNHPLGPSELYPLTCDTHLRPLRVLGALTVSGGRVHESSGRGARLRPVLLSELANRLGFSPCATPSPRERRNVAQGATPVRLLPSTYDTHLHGLYVLTSHIPRLCACMHLGGASPGPRFCPCTYPIASSGAVRWATRLGLRVLIFSGERLATFVFKNSELSTSTVAAFANTDWYGISLSGDVSGICVSTFGTSRELPVLV